MMVEAFATAHPMVVRTAEEYGFVAGLQATLGQFDQASVNFDVSFYFFSRPLFSPSFLITHADLLSVPWYLSDRSSSSFESRTPGRT